MAGPWDKYATTPSAQPQSAPQQMAPWEKYAQPAQVPEEQPAYTGQILPISVDQQGNNHFDSDAGLLGMAKRAFMLPGEAMAGKVDPLSQEGIGRAGEFASVFSPVNPGVAAGDRVIPGVLQSLTQKEIAAPTTQALKEAGSAGYKQMREMGVEYSSDAVKTLAETIRAGLDEKGFIPEVAPKTASVLDKLASPPEGSVAPISGIEAARQAFSKIGQDFQNPPDRTAAKIVREGIDSFVQNYDPATVVAGPASEAANVLRDARANTAAYKRSAALSGVQDAAELSAAAANSGQNFGNALRQRVKSILLSDKAKSGFTPDEIGMLEEVVKGSPSANATRFVGNLLGGGGGLGAAVSSAVAGGGAALMSGNPYAGAIGFAAPVAGAISKKVSNALTQAALKAADETTRMRSPLAQAIRNSSPKQAIAPNSRAALIRALLMSQQQQGGGGW